MAKIDAKLLQTIINLHADKSYICIKQYYKVFYERYQTLHKKQSKTKWYSALKNKIEIFPV